MNTKELVGLLEKHLNIPDNHQIIAVFDDDPSDEVKGFVVKERGKGGHFPVLTSEELIRIYG